MAFSHGENEVMVKTRLIVKLIGYGAKIVLLC